MPYALRKRTLVTGGAGFLGSHLCERLLERRRRRALRRQLLHRHQGQHRPPAGQPALRTHPPRRDLPALRRSGRDLQPGLPGLADPLPARPGADHQDQRARRHQHAGPGQAREGEDLPGLHQRGVRRPEVHPQTEDYWGRVNPIGPAPATTKASAAPRPCSSTTTASTGCASRSPASSTPTARACTRTTAAWSPTSSCRR
jgi:UDP-glucuronate decarboxylase